MSLRTIQTRVLTQTPSLGAGIGFVFILASFRVWNIANPSAPTQAANVQTPTIDGGVGIALSGNTCWCADSNVQLTAYDVTTDASPTFLGQATPNTGAGIQKGLALSGSNVLVLKANLVAGTQNPLIAIFDGSNPAAPTLIQTYNLNTGFATSQKGRLLSIAVRAGVASVINFDTTVIANHSFVATYNVSNPAAVTQLGSVDLGASFAAGDGNPLVPLVSLAQTGTTLFAGTCGNGGVTAAKVRTISLANPAAPSVTHTTTLSVSDQSIFLTLDALGTTLYVLTTTNIFIYDVTNPNAPSLTSTISLSGLSPGRPAPSWLYVLQGIAYVGQPGDGEATALFSVYRISDGAGLSLNTVLQPPPTSVTGIAITSKTV
jgi:hypothetical protein